MTKYTSFSYSWALIFTRSSASDSAYQITVIQQDILKILFIYNWKIIIIVIIKLTLVSVLPYINMNQP